MLCFLIEDLAGPMCVQDRPRSEVAYIKVKRCGIVKSSDCRVSRVKILRCPSLFFSMANGDSSLAANCRTSEIEHQNGHPRTRDHN